MVVAAGSGCSAPAVDDQTPHRITFSVLGPVLMDVSYAAGAEKARADGVFNEWSHTMTISGPLTSVEMTVVPVPDPGGAIYILELGCAIEVDGVLVTREMSRGDPADVTCTFSAFAR